MTTAAADLLDTASRLRAEAGRLEQLAGSLFSGCDALALAVQMVTSARLAWHAETDKAASTILARHWRAPNHGDVERIDYRTVEPVDILVAGFPCQDTSPAGKRAGVDAGARSGLWREAVRALRALRPGLFFVENSAGLLAPGRGFDTIARDLAESGYRFAWSCLRASDIGAPHRRERVFILAAPDVPRERRQGTAEGATKAGRRQPREPLADDHSARREGQQASDSQQAALEVARRDNPQRCGACAAPDTDSNALRVEPERQQPNAPERGYAESLDLGRFRPAIERWERILGRVAPPLAVTGVRSQPVLNPAFSEWMMGLPPGWTEGIARTARLRVIGNACVPQQAAHAFVGLRARLEAA